MLQRWTREQDLAILYVKLEHKGQLTSTHPAIGMIAKARRWYCLLSSLAQQAVFEADVIGSLQLSSAPKDGRR